MEKIDRAAVGNVGKSFTLKDQNGTDVSLASVLERGPVLLVFYGKDTAKLSTEQLCSFRDNFDEFKNLGIQILGISPSSVEEHKVFTSVHGFPFTILSDPNKDVAKSYGCISAVMLGGVSRGLVVLNKKGIILYRHSEQNPVSPEEPGSLVKVVGDLKKKGYI